MKKKFKALAVSLFIAITMFAGQASAYTPTTADKDLMARLVTAEAGGEPYAGKVAVAVVVMNRVAHKDFPNTVRGVIYETYSNGKYYAFSPVQNGTIKKPASAESKRAVKEALTYKPNPNRSIFFYNPKTATSKWILTRTVVIRIGNHTFAK